MHRLSKGLALFVGLTALSAVGSEIRWSTKYPDDARPLVSPNGKFRIVNKDDLNGPLAHGLFLVQGDNNEKPLHEYGRHVRVAWSPSSQNVAVTDFVGSDESTCVLFDIESSKSIDLASAVPDQARELQAILKNHHAYTECTKWISSTVVEVRFTGWGDGDTKRHTRVARYKLGKGFELAMNAVKK